VTSALLWCFSCQSYLLECPWPTEILETSHGREIFDADGNTIYRGLSVRMGIHWGRPVCEPDPITRRMDYFGPMVNRAARISAVADGGQISVSSDAIGEIRRTLETYAEDDRRDSIGSQDTINDDPKGHQIRRELSQLSSQGFEVKELGEKKLKGLENPEFIYLIYPHSLAGRLAVQPEGDKGAEMGSGAAAALGRDTQLDLDPGNVWAMWDLALRLEMLCSCLENPDKAALLRKPELSLLTRMRDSGGEITDEFMVNLLEHQVTRIEVCFCPAHPELMPIADLFAFGVGMHEHAANSPHAPAHEEGRRTEPPRAAHRGGHARAASGSRRVSTGHGRGDWLRHHLTNEIALSPERHTHDRGRSCPSHLRHQRRWFSPTVPTNDVTRTIGATN
jgi:hypothetical protein